MKQIFVIGTCDTKWEELHFVRDRLGAAGVAARILDVSTTVHDHPVDIPATEVARYHPSRPDFLQQNAGRGDAVACMALALAAFFSKGVTVDAAIGLGGSGGTALICTGLRVLPVGIPKVMVSTVASGQVAPYVGATDIFMVYSITDIAGINQISNVILSNAAHALAGMIQNGFPPYHAERPLLGMTMFGVTTPCVTQMRQQLEHDYECLVFHATGTGGQSMEKLVASGMMQHVIDITTTEICDLHMGGIMSAGEQRMDAIIDAGIPYVVSVGAMDMVNFGGIETVPEKYAHRNLYKHNPQVTLMRTTAEECAVMGRWMAHKLNRITGPVRLLIPEKGVSALSTEGQPFYDPEADTALFQALESELQQDDDRKLVRIPSDINDPMFSSVAVDMFREINQT